MKRALVTGAGARIGREMAIHLASGGFDVGVHFGSNRPGAEDTAEMVRVLGRRSFTVGADLREPGAPELVARTVLQNFGGLELLINNASVFPTPEERVSRHDFLSETLGDWELMMGVNARAPFFLTQHLAQVLAESGEGVVVNIVDSSASLPALSRACYTISRNSLVAITRLCALALNGKVRVNALELGPILAPENMPPEVKQSFCWGSVSDVLQALDQVLSDSGMTGEILRVNPLLVE